MRNAANHGYAADSVSSSLGSGGRHAQALCGVDTARAKSNAQPEHNVL